MDRVWLAFDALDLWFFRDGRPFDAGEAHWARSRFPPPPETVMGATRAMLMHGEFATKGKTDIDLPHYNRWLYGRWEKNASVSASEEAQAAFEAAAGRYGAGAVVGEGIELCGPFVVQPGNDGTRPGGRLLSRAPRDLLMNNQDPSHARLVRLEPVADQTAGSLTATHWNPPSGAHPTETNFPRPLIADASGEDLEGATWITFDTLQRYLEGLVDLGAEADAPVQFETRTGIALQSSRRVRPGHLYRADLIRPNVAGDDSCRRTRLLVGCKTDQRGPWRLNFGGEGRIAQATVLDTADGLATELNGLLKPNGTVAQAVQAKAERSGWLRLVLLQPAIFDQQGWLPNGDGLSGRDITLDGHAFRLESAAVGKPEAISGWNLQERQPKPLRRAVPAGSVYHVAHIGDEEDRAAAVTAFIQHFHGTDKLVADENARRTGYGLTVVGACKPQNPKA